MSVDRRAFVLGEELGRQLCGLLGIDPHRVAAMDLQLQPGEPATVVLTRFLTPGEADTVVEVVRLAMTTGPSEPPMAPTGRHPLAGIPEPAGGGGGGIPAPSKAGTTPPTGANTHTGFAM